jgi:hypothetical protein
MSNRNQSKWKEQRMSMKPTRGDEGDAEAKPRPAKKQAPGNGPSKRKIANAVAKGGYKLGSGIRRYIAR